MQPELANALVLAREDVVKIKKLVRNGHAARERRNLQIGEGPPSQRAPGSLDEVRN